MSTDQPNRALRISQLRHLAFGDTRAKSRTLAQTSSSVWLHALSETPFSLFYPLSAIYQKPPFAESALCHHGVTTLVSAPYLTQTLRLVANYVMPVRSPTVQFSPM